MLKIIIPMDIVLYLFKKKKPLIFIIYHQTTIKMIDSIIPDNLNDILLLLKLDINSIRFWS